MKKQLVKINIKLMTVLSVFMFLVPMCISVPLELTALKNFNIAVHWYDFLIVLGLYIVLIALHEGLHALGMLMVGIPPKNIKFGMIPKQGMLYCTCDVPMTADKYMLVLMLPILVTGILPWIIATIYLNIVYVALFAGLIVGGAGDVYMIAKLSKYPSKQLISDHPEAPAFYLLYKENELPEDFKEVTEEDERALREELYKRGKRK